MDDPLEGLWQELEGRYRREGLLGRGGMASVFLAQDLKNRRRVAIKVLQPELASAFDAERFRLEVETAAALSHPNILPLFDSGEAGGRLFYVMPYVEGESLRQRLDREHQLSIDEAVKITCEVAQALAYAHSLGVVHRDIKPENVMFMSGNAVVTDFGVARALTATSAAPITPTGVAVGTPSYMSPEQASGTAVVDGRADVYAIGCVLYEMLAGSVPFSGPTPQAVMARHTVDAVPPIRTVRPTVPDALEQVILKALAKTPADRYATASQLADALRARAPAPADGVTDESIAVLPFANLSSDPDTEYFSDGISEEIINALAQLPGLRVAARTSSFVFRSRGLDLAEVGAKLKVATILEGTVRKSGSHLRITARLIKAMDGYNLWSERYDRELTDIFAIQDEIARAIADRLQVTFGGQGLPAAPPTRSLDAYHLYLKGRYHWAQRGLGLRRALECFSQALTLDPNYAAAHAGLADAWTLLGIHGVAPPSEVLPRARAAIQRALELAPDLAEAHCASGTLKLVFDWDWRGAERDLRRAIELNPRLVAGQYWMGIYLGMVERRFEEALGHARRAVELDPLAALPLAHLGMVLMAAGRHREALEPLQRATGLTPTVYVPFLYLGGALNFLGRPQEAVPVLETAAAMSGRQPITLASLAVSFAYLGRTDDAAAIHDELVARSRREYVQSAVLSITAATIGRMEEAFTLLHRACEERDGVLMYSRTYPAFAGLQNDPRMAEVYRRVGFPD
jgi:eukaryotic-like serine/threonine-protein kinase